MECFGKYSENDSPTLEEIDEDRKEQEEVRKEQEAEDLKEIKRSTQRKTSVFNRFTVILRVITIFIGIGHFICGCFAVMNVLLYKMRTERLILYGLYTCDSVTQNGEGIFTAYYMIVHSTLSLLILYVTSTILSIILIFWMISVWFVAAFVTFSHVHSLISLAGNDRVQKHVIMGAIGLMIAINVTFVIVLIFYCHLNNYLCLFLREKVMRTNRIINREILAKRMNRFTLLKKATSWGGKVQSLRLVQKLKSENRALNEPTKEELQFDLDEALYSFSQVHGTSHLKMYQMVNPGEEVFVQPIPRDVYYRDEYRHNQRQCPFQCLRFKPHNKVHPSEENIKKTVSKTETEKKDSVTETEKKDSTNETENIVEVKKKPIKMKRSKSVQLQSYRMGFDREKSITSVQDESHSSNTFY